MGSFSRLLQLLGGAILAVSLLWLATFRFGAPLPGMFPAMDNAPAAFSLAVLGGAMVILGMWFKTLERRRSGPRVRFQDAIHATTDQKPGESSKDAMNRVIATRPEVDKGRTRLIIAIPPRPTQSWIGGVPHLPDSEPWPILHGRPAGFVAQIALADLPRSIWGGYGPRDGWLVFFAESCSDNSAGLVLHVTGRVTPRTPPEGALPVPHFAEEKAIAALRDLAGETVTTLPRWYLEAVPDSTSDYTHPDVMDALERADWRAPLEAVRALPPEDRMPFDAVTERGWLAALDKALVGYLTQRRKTLSDAEGKRLQGSVERMVAHLRLLASGTDLTTVQGRAAVIAAVAEMPTIDLLSSADQVAGKTTVPLTHWVLFDDYRLLFEAQARRLYADGAHLLPEALRRTLEPIWQAETALTWIFSGSTEGIDPPFADDDARLIDMPSSRLTGLTFGDLSRWCVTIPPEALGTRHFDQAAALSSHGQF
jgi:hypothetical protein